MEEEIVFNRFDQVRILHTKNVTYVSGPPGSEILPTGVWSVVGGINNELLLAKNNTVIRIPTDDVLKISTYDLSKLTSLLGNLTKHVQAKAKNQIK